MRHSVKPCNDCGGQKMPGSGQRYCQPCREARKPMFEREEYKLRKERASMTRRPEAGPRKLASKAPEGQKWCSRCQQYLALVEFGTRGAKLAAYCRPCASAYNHERILAQEFGITPQRYDELLDLQGGRCAICERKPRTRRLAVDHDHETGQIRGLLCTRCNHKLLGAAHDSRPMLRRAARYLEKPPAVTGEPVSASDSDILELFLEQWVTHREAVNDGADFGVAWIKRRGKTDAKDGYVVMTGDTFMRLIEQAGY